MYCTACGNKIDKGDAYCENCGMQLSGETSVDKMLQIAATNRMNKKPLNKKMLIISALVTCIVLAIVFIITNQPPKYNVEDYVVIEYSGFNGYGKSYIDFDRDRLVEDIEKGLYKKEKSSLKDYLDDDWYANNRKIYEYVNGIEVELSKTENVRNGDTLTAEIKYDNKLISDLKFRFSGEKIETVVEGLIDAVEINPFEDLVVTFSGRSPSGKMDLEYNGDSKFVREYDFYYDMPNGLKNGDEIIIYVDDSYENTLNNGCVFTQTEKSYTVSGLDEYIQNYDDITTEFEEKLKTQTQDTIMAYNANSHDGKYSLGDLSYEGYILFVKKGEKRNYDNYNELYYIYSGEVSSSENRFDPCTVYFPVKYTNVLSSEGKLSYEKNEGIEGYSDLNYTNYWSDYANYMTEIKGYNNPYICYSELVDANLSEFNVTCADGFEIFSEYKKINLLSDIEQEYKTSLEEKAIDIIMSYTAKQYHENTVVSELKKEGEYLLTLKEQGMDYYNNNRYIIVYSAEVSHKNGYINKQKVYYPVEYRGVVALPNEKFMCHECAGIQGSVKLSGKKGFYTDGYIDTEEMFSKLVTARRERYKYEMSEGLKIYGE